MNLTIRYADSLDDLALIRLAALDSASPLSLPALVADIEGDLRAALSLADGSVVADPFRPTAELVELLHLRAAQLAGPARACSASAPGRAGPARAAAPAARRPTAT